MNAEENPPLIKCPTGLVERCNAYKKQPCKNCPIPAESIESDKLGSEDKS